jgi:glucan phosphoethanolaminetransferase (alkaline phosphatase superfamily)
MLTLLAPSLAMVSSGAGALWNTAIAWACFFAALSAFGVPAKVFQYLLIVLTLLIPATAAWTAYASLNGLGPAVEAVSAVLTTNQREVTSAFSQVIARPTFIVPFALHVILLIATWIVWIRHGATRLSKTALLVGLAVIFAFQIMQAFSSMGQRIWKPADISSSLVLSYADWAIAAWQNDLWRNDWRTRNHSLPDPPATKRPVGSELAIFVIGESTRYDELGPGKAGRGQWSKALQERVQAGLGVWTPPVCSTADFTSQSVPMMITGTSADRYAEVFAAPTLVNRLRAAGYKTAWIRNQDDAYGGADFVWDAAYSSRTTYDSELLDPTERFFAPLLLSADTRPRAAILHMAGAHVPYIERYPPGMFPPEPEGLSEDAREDLEYDRANEGVAQMLAGLGELMDRSSVPALLVFLSDHGENLSSDQNGLRLHMAARVSLAGDLVPGLILWNRVYADTHNPAVQLADLLRARRIAQQDVHHAFLVLADISNDSITATPDPLVRGIFEKGGPAIVGSCYSLKP